MKKWMTKAAALVLAGSMLLQPAFVQADTQTQTQEEQTTETKQSDQKVIVIDAGHQTRAMSATEPNGPGSKTRKAKVTGGATGVATHLPEYKLNLIVAKKLKKELTSRGYKVIMVRTKNNVRLSNVDRAKIANKYKADAFIRIHANSANSKPDTCNSQKIRECHKADNQEKECPQKKSGTVKESTESILQSYRSEKPWSDVHQYHDRH